MKYSEQLGAKRQVGPSNGETANWYARTTITITMTAHLPITAETCVIREPESPRASW